MADSKSALAVFAHPDDIEFCAAGTLLLLAEQGWNIHYFNLSSGEQQLPNSPIKLTLGYLNQTQKMRLDCL